MSPPFSSGSTGISAKYSGARNAKSSALSVTVHAVPVTLGAQMSFAVPMVPGKGGMIWPSISACNTAFSICLRSCRRTESFDLSSICMGLIATTTIDDRMP
ncbi:MAG: hypothetical protein KBC47_01070, partial [Candidatus Peribacteraceae bacterium]|nr:hypothetical protein [Candidatus Peribacteraceae bacterium]